MTSITELVQPDGDMQINCALRVLTRDGQETRTLRIMPDTRYIEPFQIEITPSLTAEAIYFQYSAQLFESSADEDVPLYEQSNAGVNRTSISLRTGHLGGLLVLHVRGLVETSTGDRYYTDWMQHQIEIVGVNPTLFTVFKGDWPRAMLLLGYYRTKLQMFNDQGLPLVNGDEYGMMAMTGVATIGQWNWHKHLQIAKTRWQRQEAYVKAKPRILRETDPKHYKGLPDFTAEQLQLEILQSYDKGNYFEPVRERQGLFKRWVWRKVSDQQLFADKIMLVKDELESVNLESAS